ncbi:hypothetical protein A3762_15700 [Oleiphilus sp. HI0125]|uniref:hypothetical protein n=2 Tax=Oleiphilus sp. HI0125 TaxID=1822266 RepID=UPI0007C316FE|nr:hypothetical protein [Oleiphilus sp. HI0125]KZZ60199.1 hypothetical protein A3762_15700 [Oleiphilus sp. HI0125]
MIQKTLQKELLSFFVLLFPIIELVLLGLNHAVFFIIGLSAVMFALNFSSLFSNLRKFIPAINLVLFASIFVVHLTSGVNSVAVMGCLLVMTVWAALVLDLVFAATFSLLCMLLLSALNDFTQLAQNAVLVFSLFALASFVRFRIGRLERAGPKHTEEDMFACRNARQFEQDLSHYFALHQRYQMNCVLLVIDVELPRKMNLTKERTLLQVLVSIWKSRIRSTDLLYKLSDRRFACLVTATNRDGAQILLNDLKKATQDYQLPEGLNPEVYISLHDCAEQNSEKSWLDKSYQD